MRTTAAAAGCAAQMLLRGNFMRKNLIVYSGYRRLPRGTADGPLTKGCLILEGGGWRTLYTQGALDVLLESGVFIQTVIGVSAGAMSSLAYCGGNIGLSARVNLKYCLDPEYSGRGAFLSDRGVTGFHYFFDRLLPAFGFDWGRISPERRLVAVATDRLTGRPEYFTYGKCDFKKAVAASATLPYVSLPVMIDGIPYLDGGCSCRIPYGWALDEGYDKIVVIRTRDRGFRRPEGKDRRLNALFYSLHPEFREAIDRSAGSYNAVIEQLGRDEATGRTFVLAPRTPVDVSRFERDVEKLGRLYESGRRDMLSRLDSLREYLGIN